MEENGRYGVQVNIEWSTILWTRGARFPKTLKVRTLPEEWWSPPYFKITHLLHRRFMLPHSISPLPSTLKRHLYTHSHLISHVTSSTCCEMAWSIIWQSNRAWPTDTRIYFYEVDKQVRKRNIQYDPNLVFKTLL